QKDGGVKKQAGQKQEVGVHDHRGSPGRASLDNTQYRGTGLKRLSNGGGRRAVFLSAGRKKIDGKRHKKIARPPRAGARMRIGRPVFFWRTAAYVIHPSIACRGCAKTWGCPAGRWTG